MAFSAKAVVAVLVLVALAICSCSAVDVLPLRIDNPAPDGSGVVFFQLQAATAGASFANFKIISTSISGSQSLKLWNAAAGTCDGTTLSADGLVPTDGKVCFWGTVGAEGESSFNYAAVDGDGIVGTSQKVVIVNYNVQSCPGIPDLGASGFATVPASPEVSITLNGLEIQFEVTASYLRNQSAWFIDFFDFDRNADSADGTGRTCSNHVSSAFTGINFPQWWQSQPRATFTSTLVGSTVSPALDDAIFPMYKSNARWGIEAAGCDKVKYTATIPTVNLISNGASDCTRNGQPTPAATANGLNYTATLYVSALRPRDINDKTKGYYQVTYTYPFSFRIQQTVTDIRTTSSAFAFQVSVDNMRVTRGQGLTLSVETIISDPNSANTPDLDSFQLTSYPHQAGHTVAPTLEFVSDNSHCPNDQHLPCAILWRVTINELTLAQLDNDMDAYNRQFVGAYTLQWTALSTPNLPLKAQLIIDAVAANSTDLGQLAVESKVNFFRSQDDMLRTDNTVGLTSPTFSSGEKIWVRHSFLVDSADVSAYVFTLQRAWVCWSPLAGFVPTINPGTGCAQDVPGVMEAALGHRFLLYNISVGGIADTVPAGSTQKSRVWGWTLVQPTSSSWTGGQTVHSGFGINALPLVSDAQPHTYYFHLVSQVSQATLPNPVAKRSARAETQEGLFMFKREDGVDTSSGAGMSSITVVSEQSASPASQLSASWASQLLVF